MTIPFTSTVKTVNVKEFKRLVRRASAIFTNSVFDSPHQMYKNYIWTQIETIYPDCDITIEVREFVADRRVYNVATRGYDIVPNDRKWHQIIIQSITHESGKIRP
jgi:hypothetical protein